MQQTPKNPSIQSPKEALEAVTAPDEKSIYASGDLLFRDADFGRDQVTVVEEVLEFEPQLAGRVLLNIASHQGLNYNLKSEEEPGRIAHEHRIDPGPEGGAQKFIFDELASKWGAENGEITYYGSVDATPQYIRALCAHAERYGLGFMDSIVIRRDGSSANLNQALDDALLWLEHKLELSSSGLVEYQQKHNLGIENQVWKDSAEFYVHESGERVNHLRPVASIEVQGLAFDALVAASRLRRPERAQELLDKAYALRDRTLDLLWQPSREYFALGVDHDPKTDKLRIINTKTANPAALLNTMFFDELPRYEKQKYITAITRTIVSSDFLTEAGIRSRALSQSEVVDFWDYHGSFVSWPKETSDIAKGLHRQGFPRLAEQLENRLWNAVSRLASYPEFIYVDAHGHMLIDKDSPRYHENLTVVYSTNKPESLQAWTIAAIYRITEERNSRTLKEEHPQDFWQFQLEWQLLEAITNTQLIKTAAELYKSYPNRPYRLQFTSQSEAGNPLGAKLKNMAS